MAIEPPDQDENSEPSEIVTELKDNHRISSGGIIQWELIGVVLEVEEKFRKNLDTKQMGKVEELVTGKE